MVGEVLRLKKGTLRWRAFKLLRESPAALFGYELVEKIPGLKYYSLQSTLNFLLDENLIVRSNDRFLNERKTRAFLFAINEALIKKRIKELRKQHKETPNKFSSGTIKPKVVNFLKETRHGFTCKELSKHLSIDDGPLSNALSILVQRASIKRSEFSIPATNSSPSNCRGFVYGIGDAAVEEGLQRLIPQSVRQAMDLISSSLKVYSSMELRERCNISYENEEAWLKNVFAARGDIRAVNRDNVLYFFNPKMPKDVVEKGIDECEYDINVIRKNNSRIGKLFEYRSLYVFVNYLKAKGEKVMVTCEFPRKLQKKKEEFAHSSRIFGFEAILSNWRLMGKRSFHQKKEAIKTDTLAGG